MASLTGHSDRVLSVTADSQGQVASCSLDKTVRVWKPKLQDSLDVSKHDAPVTFVTSTNADLIISGSEDGVLKLWKKSTGDLLELKLSFQAHDGAVNCGCFRTNSTTTFVTGGNDNAIYTWQIMDRKDGFFVRKMNSLKTGFPVSSVIGSPKSEDDFYFSTWGGDITSYRKSSGRNRIYLEGERVSTPLISMINYYKLF